MVRLRILSLLLFLFLGVAPVSVEAHPHIWIDSRVDIHVSGDRIETVRAHWTFDPYFTEMILLDYGRARNGRFNAEQVEAIRSGAFQNLRHYGYFTFLRVDGRDVPVDTVENFHAYLNSEGDLVYEFDIPVNLEIRGSRRSLAISMYDETFFTDMMFREDYAIVQGGSGISYEMELTREQHQVPIWGPMNRETVIFRFRRG